FITLLGGAAVAWPVTASAQKAERERRIGVLMHLPENDPEAQARIRALLGGLQQLGGTEGRNLRIDYRFGAADVERAPRYAAELIARVPDVIQASGTGPMAAVHEATRTVRIVFAQAADDPQGQARVAAFRQVLRQLGRSDRNVRIETRWGEND